MVYLIFSIIASTSIFVIFKIIEKLKINTFSAILINYIVAASLGFILYKNPVSISEIVNQPWFFFSFFIGALFILMFYLIALSSQKVGISVTTVASKMSVIIPIAFSIFYYNENINILKIVGICIAIVAVFLTIMKKKQDKKQVKYFLLPMLLFIGMGIVDSTVKFSQDKFALDDSSSLFSAVVFTVSGIMCIIVSFFNLKIFKNYLQPKVLLMGIILGITNFGTIYFIINALNSNIFDSSILFGINNIGIVAASVIIGLLGFKEKLSGINWIGIFLSFVAILALSYA
ncbi:MAG: DMT family transporter [Bacteroidota bacterium]